MLGARLHLIHPLGFSTDARALRRSGLDYWQALDVHEHASWEAFLGSKNTPKRLWLLTTRAQRPHWDADFSEGDGLLFGRESAGVPDWLHEDLSQQRLKIPQPQAHLRSLNLATAAGVVAYEALRQRLS